MAKCKLYIRAGAADTYIGEFSSREKAEVHYNLIKGEIKQKYGYTVQAEPVYVETGKGRGK